MKGTIRLTLFSKILILLIILGLLGGGIYAGLSSGIIKKKDKTPEQATIEKNVKQSEKNTTTSSSNSTDETNIINLSIDEWVGYKNICDAAGGLTTQEGSIYDQLGIKVNINIINDPTQSSNALIAGDVDAAGYTINRVAFLSKKFQDANCDVIFPYVTNFSNGGDGIIATSKINNVNDLVGARIGVPQFGESHAMIVWFVQNSNLSEQEKKDIIDNLILFATADETAKAFFAGELDVAATWEPYLTQAQNMSDAHIFFSTASSKSLIMSGILFNKDFAEKNPTTVQKFIEGTLMASELYEEDMVTVKDVMPMFSTASNQDILDMCAGAKLTTWADNDELLGNEAKSIYTAMCNVWQSIGEEVVPEFVDTLFDKSYNDAIKVAFADNAEQKEVAKSSNVTQVTEDNMDTILNSQAMLTKSATVTFIINTAKFDDPASASAALDEFIETAKILDGTIIEIAGNTDPNPKSDPEDTANKLLSEQRAETVKQYFVLNGIDPKRIITVGNGSSNPMYENDTEEHRALNRRTDVSFKIIE